MVKKIWLTWEVQRRNRTMSAMLGADLHEVVVSGLRPKRYFFQTIKTIGIIFKNKPAYLFVQNPSLLLSAIGVLCGKIIKATVIIDAHNAGVFPLEGQNKILNKIAARVNSLADKVIVSNPALIKFVSKPPTDVFAVPDPIPCIEGHSKYSFINNKFSLVFICSWAADEPYVEVIKLAEKLSMVVHIYITGNSHNKEKAICDVLPKNITLTGYLSDMDYEGLLASCDAVMVLTDRDDCLVCGAYEAVAVEKPMITSKKNALIKYFDKGCVYTDNSESDIEKSILKVINEREGLSLDIKKLKKENELKFKSALKSLKDDIF